MLQIFLLAAVAIFLFWRLRAVLGSRDGFEKTLKEIKESSDVVSNPKVIDETKNDMQKLISSCFDHILGF